MALAGLGASPVTAGAKSEPIPVIIVTGQNNHDWKTSTPTLKAILEETGRFKVDVDENPGALTPEKLAPYRAIISNWTSFGDSAAENEKWSPESRAAYLDFVRRGGGHVVVHAGASSFYTWPEYQEMTGKAGWKLGRTAHGAVAPFPVRLPQAKHPVTQGLEPFTTTDELWCNTGLGDNVTVLAEGFAPKTNRGDDTWQPIAAANTFGEGRNFILLLGHCKGGVVSGYENPGFQTLLSRGVEWAATGQVDLPPITKNLLAGSLSLEKLLTEPAFAALPKYRRYDNRDSLNAISRSVAHAQDAPALRSYLMDEMAAMLGREITPDSRAFLCEQLGLLGAVEKIAAIEPWALAPPTDVWALGAIQRIGGAPAREAVVRLLAKADAAQGPALILAAGRMKIDEAIPEIQKRLQNPANPAVAQAAIEALVDLGTPAALRALLEAKKTVAAPLQPIYANAVFEAARQCIAAGQTQEARTALENLIGGGGALAPLAFAENLKLDPDQGAARLAKALDDSALRDLARAAIVSGLVPAPDSVLLGLLPGLPPEEQAAVIGLLHEKDSAASLAFLKKALDDPSPAVRRQVWEALGRLGDIESAAPLLQRAASASPEEVESIRQALRLLAVDEKNRARLRELLVSAPDAQAGVLVTVLAQTGDRDILPVLFQRLRAANGDFAGTLAVAVGDLGGAAEIEPLLASQNAPKGRVQAALVAIALRQPEPSVPVLLNVWKNAAPAAQIQLVDILAATQAPSALTHLESLLKADDPALRDAAIRALGTWKTPAALDPLLQYATAATDPRARILALRSMASLLQGSKGMDDQVFSSALKRAFELSERPEEKLLFVASAKRRPSAEVREILKAQSADPALHQEIESLLSETAKKSKKK